MLTIILSQHKLLVEIVHNKIQLPNFTSLNSIKSSLQELHVSETEYVAVLEELPTVPTNLDWINLRQALNHFEEFTVSQVVYYQQLAHYYTTHKFCGICGRFTQRGRKNKFVMCHSCNTEIYPHIAPSVIVRIHKDDSILMARGVNFPAGAWGLIAGFVEIGESLEQAVKREVKEEVGIEVTNIRYWGSQPWPFPNNSLMMGFTADYVSGTITLQVEEIGAAGFYSRDNLPGMPSISYSIASKMITDYLQQTT